MTALEDVRNDISDVAVDLAAGRVAAQELVDRLRRIGDAVARAVPAASEAGHVRHCREILDLFGMSNGDVVEAVRRRVTPEVVTGAEAAELPAGSIVVQCEPDGTPLLGCTFVVGDPDEEGILLPLMPQRVLHRAPELDSDRPLAVVPARGEPPR